MPRLLVFLKTIFCVGALFASVFAFSQTLTGTWDVVESPDGRGPTAGTMTLSANGAVNFAGSRSTWQPNGSSVQFTVMGAMQVPATEITLQLNGSTLQGKLVAYKYRMSGGQAILESERAFPLSARRPDGYAAPDKSDRQSPPATVEERIAQQGARTSSSQVAGSSQGTTSPGASASSHAAAGSDSTKSRAENATSTNTVRGKAPPVMQDQLEAIAICWQNKRNQSKYSCDGPVQNLIIADYTLEEALELAGCPHPRLTDGSRTVNDKSVIVHLCGYGLISSDRDVAKRNGLTVQRNTYSCPKSQWRCKSQ